MKTWKFMVILLLLAFLNASTAWSALTGYLILEGKSSGMIGGDSTLKGLENAIRIFGFKSSMEVPRDTQTGLPTGQRMHHPLTIVKPLDESSPLLMATCASGEKMNKFELSLFRINLKGDYEMYYKIILVNAVIVDITTTMLNNTEPAFKDYPQMEEVSFTFDKITVVHVQKNIETTDDWKAPKP